jgi:hypothetical protein
MCSCLDGNNHTIEVGLLRVSEDTLMLLYKQHIMYE